ncbi:MAG: type II secretion system F family protein [Acidobacteriota bacterium]
MDLFRSRLRQRGRLYRQLATTLDAGLPLPQALETSSTGGAEGKALRSAAAALGRGETLATALRRQRVFGDFEIRVIETGEASGRLPAALVRLAHWAEGAAALRERVASSLIYPVILVHGAVLLPPLYRWVRDGWGAYLSTVGPALIALYGFAAWLVVRARRTGSTDAPRSGAAVGAGPLAVLPAAGGLVRSMALAHWAFALTTLFEAGIPLPEALRRAASASGHRGISGAGHRAALSVEAGSTLHAALGAEGFPPAVVESVRVGEVAGKLSVALDMAEGLAKDEATASASRLATFVAVAAFGLAALLVAWQVVSFWARYGSALG